MAAKPEFKTKAIVFTAKERAEVVDGIPCPKVDDESVVIKTRVIGLSRGTEMDVYTGHFHSPAEHQYPIITGYEPLGEVVYAGPKIAHLRVGDTVLGYNLATGYPKPYSTAWGASAEYVVYSRESAPTAWYTETYCAGRRVVRVPDGLSDEEALFGSLSSVAFHGVWRCGVKAGDLVVVIGLGVIGNSAAQHCQALGARVLAFDYHANRCDIARACGIETPIRGGEKEIRDVVAAYSGGAGADVVIEASGEVANIPLCFDLAKGYGRVHLQGAYLDAYPLIVQNTIFPKSLAVTSSCGATPAHQAEVFRRVADGRLKVKPMFTHWFKAAEAQAAYQMSVHEPERCLKVAFRW